MAVLKNYIILQPNIPVKLHFFDHAILSKTITDNRTGKSASRETLEFDVDMADGQSVISKLSIMSQKFADQFGPYLADKSYKNYNFTITQNGSGFQTSYTVLATPA